MDKERQLPANDISVYRWFLYAYFFLYLLPFALLIWSAEFDPGEFETAHHLALATAYGAIYLASGGYWKLLFRMVPKRRVVLSEERLTAIRGAIGRKRELAASLANGAGWLATSFILLYYLLGGYRKLLMLGSDMDASEFRFIGYDDTSRVLTALLEIARRILMPMALLYRLSYNRYCATGGDRVLALFVTAALMGAVVNLDRGPIFLYLLLFFFYYLMTSPSSALKKGCYSMGFVLLVGVVGCFTTYLQYNKMNFTLEQIYQTVTAVLVNRIFFDPVRMAQNYVFSDGSLYGAPVFLKYSRLNALFGGEYVGTDHIYSRYVVPAGFIADLWRNFGAAGTIFFAFCHGSAFTLLSGTLRRCDFITALPVYFLFIVLTASMMYSGIFSQGPFALAVMILILLWLQRLRPGGASCSGGT